MPHEAAPDFGDIKVRHEAESLPRHAMGTIQRVHFLRAIFEMQKYIHTKDIHSFHAELAFSSLALLHT